MTDQTASPADDQAIWIEVLRRKLDVLEARMDRFDEALHANDERTARIDKNTAEVVSLLHDWKGAIKTAETVGKALKPMAAIVAALATIAASVLGFFHMNGGPGR